MGTNTVEGKGQAWYCLRSKPKNEHLAAAHLRESGIEAFAPRIRFKRKTRRGPVWFTEALFPSYLFARFDREQSLRQVHHSRGVAGIVHFGELWPTVPSQDIETLRSTFGVEEIHTIHVEFAPGKEVEIATGPFQGLEAVVQKVIPATQRVELLLEFLGRQTSVQLNSKDLISRHPPRTAL